MVGEQRVKDFELRAPLVIDGESMDEIIVELAKLLLQFGVERIMSSYIMWELPSVCITLRNPAKSVITLHERQMNPLYLNAELEWFNSGSLYARDIDPTGNSRALTANPNGTVNSNYGFLALTEVHAGLSQYEWCVRQLQANTYTNRAVINYNQPRHKYTGVQDFPTVISQSFKYREDGCLHTVVHSRSCDVHDGLAYDVPWFASLLAKLCADTELNMGTYTQWIESLYVRETEMDILRRVAETGG